MAQLIAIKFELAYAAKHCCDRLQRARLLIKMAAVDEKIKAGIYYQPPMKMRAYAAS